MEFTGLHNSSPWSPCNPVLHWIPEGTAGTEGLSLQTTGLKRSFKPWVKLIFKNGGDRRSSTYPSKSEVLPLQRKARPNQTYWLRMTDRGTGFLWAFRSSSILVPGLIRILMIIKCCSCLQCKNWYDHVTPSNVICIPVSFYSGCNRNVKRPQESFSDLPLLVLQRNTMRNFMQLFWVQLFLNNVIWSINF